MLRGIYSSNLTGFSKKKNTPQNSIIFENKFCPFLFEGIWATHWSSSRSSRRQLGDECLKNALHKKKQTCQLGKTDANGMLSEGQLGRYRWGRGVVWGSERCWCPHTPEILSWHHAMHCACDSWHTVTCQWPSGALSWCTHTPCKMKWISGCLECICQNTEPNPTELDLLTKTASYTEVIHPCWQKHAPAPTDLNLALFNFGCH